MKDLTTAEAHNQIDVLTKRLTEAKTDLAKWQIEFEFKVDPHTLDVTIMAKNPKPGVKGARKTLTLDEISYHATDMDGLVRVVSDEFIEFFYKQMIYQDLHDRLIPLFKNNLKIAGKL